MSVELPPEADRFGDSRLHADVTFSAGEINWRHYGVLVGWSNGRPKPKTQMDETGAELYCCEYLPLNFWWSTLIHEVVEPLRGKNPVLFEDLVSGFEEGPSAGGYDEDCVPESYVEGKRYGLAH